MRIISYIMLIFALLLQGAIARTLPIAIPDVAMSQQHTAVTPPCHQPADIDNADLRVAAHDCCADHDDHMARCHTMTDPACSDGCAQCQTHHSCFAELLAYRFFASPLLSEPVPFQIITLSSQFSNVPTPPPSA